MKIRRTAVVLLTATCAATAAAPALAASETSNVGVTLSTSSAGTRQFDVVQEASAETLSALDLTAGAKTFRTRVTDTGFDALGKDYSVSATMSNLYLKTGDTYDVATKIPSSQLSLSKGALSVDPLDLAVLPSLGIDGKLPDCTALDATTKSLLGLPTTEGLSLLQLLSTATGPVVDLCTSLTGGKTVQGTLDGVVQTVRATVADVTKLPNALTNGPAGPFTVADHTQDATAKLDPEKPSSAPTAVNVMSGAKGVALPLDLVTAVKGQLTNRLSNTPLASADGSGALASTSAVLTGLTDSTFAGVLGALSTEQQTALLNTLTATALSVADPVLSRVKITTRYYGKPTLRVNLDAPVSGTYGGTMTLTFVQG